MLFTFNEQDELLGMRNLGQITGETICCGKKRNHHKDQ